MHTDNKKRNYGIIVRYLSFFVLITMIFFQARYFKEKISDVKARCGDYQIIVYDVSKDTADNILKDKMFDNAEKFVQTIMQTDNGIINCIYTSYNYLYLSMNKIIVGDFPKNANEIMIDDACASNFGKSFSDSIQKSIILNSDKIYTITGVVTKEDEWIFPEPNTFIFSMEAAPDIGVCSVILHSDFPSIYLLQKYIELKYDTKNISVNSSLLTETGFDRFGFPRSSETVVSSINLLTLIFSVVVIFLIFKSDKKNLETLKIISVALVSISICLTICEIKNTKKLNTDFSDFEYKLYVTDNRLVSKESIKAYLEDEINKYGINLYDIRYGHMNISLSKDYLSESYIDFYRNLSMDKASQVSPYSAKTISPAVMIYADKETMEKIIQNYDGTELSGNECIAIKNMYSKYESGFEFLVQESSSITLDAFKSDEDISHESLTIKKIYNNISVLSDDIINLPILFVSKDVYNNYSNMLSKRIVYFNKSAEDAQALQKDFFNLCGFVFTDLQQLNKYYTQIEGQLILNLVGLSVMSALIYALHIFNSNYVKNKKETILMNFATVPAYFFSCIAVSYFLYSLSIKTAVYHKYTVPVYEILFSLVFLLLFLNIKSLIHLKQPKQF